MQATPGTFLPGLEKYKKAVKQIRKIQIVMIAIVLMFAIAIPTVYGDPSAGDSEQEVVDFPLGNWLDASGSTLIEAERATAYYITRGPVDLVNSFIEEIYIDVFEQEATTAGTAMTAINVVSDALRGVGYFLVVVSIGIMLIKEISSGNITLESVLKLSCMSIIGFILVKFIGNIMRAVELIGELIRQTVSSNLATPTDTAFNDSVVQLIQSQFGTGAVSDVAVIGDIVNMVTNMLSTLILFAIYASVLFTLYKIVLPLYLIMLEILVRRAFAPLAIGGLIRDGFHGPSVEFIKQYLACYVRITMMYVIVYAASFIRVAILEPMFDNANLSFIAMMIQVYLINIASGRASAHADRWSKNVLGGH